MSDNQFSNRWDNERTDLCVKLWNEGLSCSVIARRIGGGISRNAVIGKIHRLGLSNTRQIHHPRHGFATKLGKYFGSPFQPWTRSDKDVLRQMWDGGYPVAAIAERLGRTRGACRRKAELIGLERRFTPSEMPTEPLPPEPERPAKLYTLADLEDDQCRYIWGDPKKADSGYCGCKKVPGSPYCEGHHARMYTAPKPKSRYNPAGQPPAGIPKQIAKYIPSAEDCVEAIA